MDLLLRKLEHLITLTDADRQLLQAESSHVLRIGPRVDLFQGSDDANHVHVILDGWVCRYKQLDDGRRQIVAFGVPGDLCDPMVVLLRRTNPAFSSLTDLKVARLGVDRMQALIAQSPNIARALWLDCLANAEIQREWTVNVGRRDAVERMAHLFCELPLRLNAVGLSDGTDCELPLTQADLGDVLALSTVHVNRTLQELRATGLVELRGHRLKINDLPALRALAMFDPRYLHLKPDALF